MADAAFDIPGAITTAAQQYGVDPDFALRVAKAESNLNPSAVSPKGALGVFQLMPKTAKGLGVDPHDVHQNIQGGVKYLRQLHDQFGGDQELVAAAYNAGPGKVQKAGGVPDIPETKKYVASVTGQPSLPGSTKELDSIFGVERPTAEPEAAPAPAAVAPSLPDQSKLDQAFGVSRQAAAPKRPVLTLSQKAAQAHADADLKNDPLIQHPGVFNVVNSAFLGGLPYLGGKASALGAAAQNALAGVGIGHPTAYSPHDVDVAERGAYQHALEGYQQAHPVANVAQQILPMAFAAAPRAIAKTGEAVIAKVAPKVVAKPLGRAAARVAGTAAVGGAYGAGTAASEGQDAGGIAKSAGETALLSVPLGVAGEAVGAVAPHVPAGRIIAPAVGAGLGAAYGSVTDGAEGAKRDAIMGGALGMMGGRGRHAAAEPTAAEQARALELVSRAAPPGALEQAHAPLTTLEALGPEGHRLARVAGAGGNPPEAVTEAINARQDKSAVMGRVSSELADITGVDPQTARMDAAAHVDAARTGPAKQAYDEAITGKGVWTPELAELAQEPKVATAMNQARILLGSRGLVANPEAATEAPFPPNMSSAELRARMTDAGKVQPGQEVSTNDLLEYLKKGGPSVYNLAPANPERIPSDEMWDWTKRMLDKSVEYDAFGHQVPNAENTMRAHWSGAVREATNQAIPGLKEARGIAGEYKSFRDAQALGHDLWGRNGETGASFAKGYADLSPAEQRATQMGYLARAHGDLERGQFSLERAQSPYHRSVQETLFGADRARDLQTVFRREQAFAKAAKDIHSSLKPAAAAENEHGGAVMGMTMAAADHGLNPHALMHGAVAGAVGKGVSGLARAAKAGNLTPGVRNALSQIGAQSPHETAKQLRALSQRRSEISAKDYLAQSALRGVSVVAAHSAGHALHGLTTVSREEGR